MIIAIDGCVATGKSTVARLLAESISFIFFDTGAMYRAVTYAIMKHQIDLRNVEQLREFLAHFDFDIKVSKGEKKYIVENEDVTIDIRTNTVTSKVSEVSAIKEIRDKLVELQRQFALGVNAVFEGRDMGTVVFPNATVKIFLTGRPEVRAKRRFDEMKSKYPKEAENLTLEKCLEDINQRDLYDTTRENSPLRQAADAFVIDTSDLTIDEIVFRILEYKDSIKTRKPKS